jgi:P-type Cu+ transporter
MRDPVCGMTLAPEDAKATSAYLGCPYHFCSPACRQKFDANPREYLSDSSLGA